MDLRRLALWISLSALVGLVVSLWVLARVSEVERVGTERAVEQFEARRAAVDDLEPILRVDPDGRLVRRLPPDGETRPVRVLRVLAYRRDLGGLVSADIPLWFLSLKGPAIDLALRGTGIDLDTLGLSAKELRRHGPSLVLDEHRANGDRLLLWTEGP